jgi:MFS family permease
VQIQYPEKSDLEARTLRRVVWPIFLTVSIQSLVCMTAVTVPVFMPVLTADMNISSSYTGIFVTLIYVGATISAPFSGYIIDRFGPVFVSQICLVLCALGLAAVSTASILWFMVGAFIMGLGYGPVTPASSHLLARNSPPGIMSVVFSIKQTGVPLGGAMAGAIVPHLVIFCGWRRTALLVGAFNIILSLLILPWRKKFDGYSRTFSPFYWKYAVAPIKITFLNRELRQIVVTSFFFITMQLCLVSFLVIYLTQDVGMTLIQAGLMLSVAQTAGVIGRVAWGGLVDRYRNPYSMLGMMGLAMAFGAICLAMFSPGWPFAAVLIICLLLGAVAIGWNGVYLAEVARLVKPQNAGMATGGSLFFTYCGVLLGLPAFSIIVDATGSYPIGFVSAAAGTLICGLLLIFSRRSR